MYHSDYIKMYYTRICYTYTTIKTIIYNTPVQTSFIIYINSSPMTSTSLYINLFNFWLISIICYRRFIQAYKVINCKCIKISFRTKHIFTVTVEVKRSGTTKVTTEKQYNCYNGRPSIAHSQATTMYIMKFDILITQIHTLLGINLHHCV